MWPDSACNNAGHAHTHARLGLILAHLADSFTDKIASLTSNAFIIDTLTRAGLVTSGA